MTELEIFQYIDSIITKEKIQACIDDKELFGITAKEIADHFSIYRSTVSNVLNNAVKEGTYIKINSRPVLFLPKKVLAEIVPFIQIQNEYTKTEIEATFFTNTEKDPFSVLIGYDGSQAYQVKQAQSAILYPPKGLHTLITGESGTGKTLFAHAMYNYGKLVLSSKHEDFPFVEFNCADYYHNPQLLLSQLFGHIRGAFTGAEKETSGLVEKANHGILFLDEIHRLPPEGQELLFYLMDSGQYRKMGEANTTRKADVLIIGATTENPNDVLLKTFKRRIPLSIELPPLRERPVIERLKIIEHLFSNEASITQRTYIVDAKIIKAMTLFNFPENIGQLASEIKILCARSFLENKESNVAEIQVPYHFLSENIRDYYQDNNTEFNFDKELDNYNYDLKITPLKEISNLKTRYLNEQSYTHLIQEIGTYSKQGLTSQQVAQKISSAVTDYYDDILKQTSFKNIDKNEIDKIIDPSIVDFSIQLMNETKSKLKVNISEQNILILAFHLKFLIERLKRNPLQISSKTKTNDLIVDEMINKIEKHFEVLLPEDEKNFFLLLIQNITNNTLAKTNNNERAVLYILAHGNTATSIAEVCNRLLHTDTVQAFDMPLTQDVQTSYRLFLERIKTIHPSKGIIILADMGSLLNFGKRITKDTGIPTHTIPNVSTAIALDFAHVMLNRNEHVDITYNEYLIKNHKNVRNETTQKEPAIISTCSSGRGTSIAFKESIEELLKINKLDSVKVFALMNSQLQENNGEFKNILNTYQVLAIVGNVRINTSIPFFHITELLSEDRKRNFINFITNNVTRKESIGLSQQNNSDDIITFLAKHVLYVNPFAVEKVGNQFLDTIFAKLEIKTKDLNDLRFSLILHIGFMLERIITNKNILFDQKESFIKKHDSAFKIIRSSIIDMESAFNLSISDDEICYILMTLYPENE